MGTKFQSELPSEPSDPTIHVYNLWFLIGIVSLDTIILIRINNRK